MEDKNPTNLPNLKMLFNEISLYHAQDDFPNDLRATLERQNNALLQYKQWINMLMSILKQTEYSDYYDNILKGLEKIEPFIKENQQLKYLIKMQSMENEERRKEVSNLNDSINKLKASLRGNPIGDHILEKSQLIESIDSISNDVDFNSEKNKNYTEFLESSEGRLNEMKIELENLKEENLNLRSLIKRKVLNNFALRNMPIKKSTANRTNCTQFFSLSKFLCSSPSSDGNDEYSTINFK